MQTTPQLYEAQLRPKFTEELLLQLLNRNQAEKELGGGDGYTAMVYRTKPTQLFAECVLPEFLKCKPLDFKGTRESSDSPMTCPYMVECPWLRPLLPKLAQACQGQSLKKMMTDKYARRVRIKKIETEIES
ncbi:hypothetical protein Tco_0607756 [Tanacetum coccineum]